MAGEVVLNSCQDRKAGLRLEGIGGALVANVSDGYDGDGPGDVLALALGVVEALDFINLGKLFEDEAFVVP